MLIHRENVMKAHQHISSCSIQRDHFKKTILIQNLIKIFTKTHQIAHFIKISRRVAYPLASVQLISLFLYEKNHFFDQNAIKIYTKMTIFSKFSCVTYASELLALYECK